VVVAIPLWAFADNVYNCFIIVLSGSPIFVGKGDCGFWVLEMEQATKFIDNM
jgi:hypothetical protein